MSTDETSTTLLASVLKPGIWVYLDGRNEHGTHVIALPFQSASIEQIDINECAEAIMAEAEAAGFQNGDSVWTTWSRFNGQYGFEGRCEIAPGWEFVMVDVELSHAINAAWKSVNGN